MTEEQVVQVILALKGIGSAIGGLCLVTALGFLSLAIANLDSAYWRNLSPQLRASRSSVRAPIERQ